MTELAIRSDERVAIVGKTGSGKTYLSRVLTWGLERLVCFDPKSTLGLAQDWRLEDWTAKGRRDLLAGKPVRLRVPGPSPDDNPETYWLPYLRDLYDAGDVVLFIDEVYGVIPPGKTPSPELTALYTRGRELGIGVFAASQRPKLVPLFMLSESDWFFTFRLLLEDDRKRMAEVCGPDVMASPSDPYGFWLYNVAWDAPIYSKGI